MVLQPLSIIFTVHTGQQQRAPRAPSYMYMGACTRSIVHPWSALQQQQLLRASQRGGWIVVR